MTFLLCEAEMRLKDNALIKLNKLIKWTDIKEKMGDLGRSGYNGIRLSASSIISCIWIINPDILILIS